MSSSAATKVELGKPTRKPASAPAATTERPLVLPLVLVGSVVLHGAILALAALLPGPPEHIARVDDELTFTTVEPPQEVEPEPEPPEPEPEEPAPAAAPEPRRRPSPPPPPAPVLTATEDATPSDWEHPEGDPEGELDGQVGGVVGGTGTEVGAAQSEATPEPRGVSRAELRRQLLGYIRGPLSRYIAEHTSYPIAARREHVEGVVVLRLRLDRAGQVLAVRLSRSSGHSMLDDAALASVRGLTSLPAPPASLPWDDAQELPLPVTYRLR